MRKKSFISLAILSLVATGCQEVEHTHSYELKGDSAWSWVMGEDEIWKSANVTFTCFGCEDTVAGHSLTLGVPVTSKITVEPTCTTTGTKIYTASVEFGGKTYSDTKEETLKSIGHEAAIEWSSNEINHWKACEHDMCNTHIDEAPHDLKETWSLDDSQHWHECETCGYKVDVGQHVFNQQVKNENTAKSAADCTHDAVYYKSCVCGAISKTETFIAAISALGHTMTKHEAVAPTCEENGSLEYYTCSREPGVFYKDENGSDIFSDIKDIVVGAIGHKVAEEWSSDETSHWHICEHDGCNKHFDVAAHDLKETWSLDDSQHWHECETCGYKTDVGQHIFNQQVKNESTAKSAADCTHDAVYYKSCICGAISKTETFADEGSNLGHDMTKHECVPPKYNANGVKEYYTCSREPGVLFANESGTETFDEEDLAILPEDWMFVPGDEYGFNWDMSQYHDENAEYLPFIFTSEGFFYDDSGCIIADIPEEDVETDTTHYMFMNMKPFYPNGRFEDDEYIGHPVDDQLCMLKASKIILHMAYQVWEYVGAVLVNSDLDFSLIDTYDFNTQTYTIDVTQFTKEKDYSDFEIYFLLLNAHASAFPRDGSELKTFGVEIVGELVAYEE